jgi:hypothetical protein
MRSTALKRFLLISCLGVASAVVGASQLPRADYILDIVTYPLTPERPSGAAPQLAPGFASVTEGEDLTRGIRIKLESLDRLDYHRGDALIYEVLIENIGPRSVVLPWSPDRVAVQGSVPDTTSIRQVVLSLSVTDRPGTPGALLEPIALYGHESLRGTLQTLSVGEKARVRVPGVWKPFWGKSGPEAPEQPMHVSAMLSGLNPVLVVLSPNTLEAIAPGPQR